MRETHAAIARVRSSGDAASHDESVSSVMTEFYSGVIVTAVPLALTMSMLAPCPIVS
jgi:hypothetical protein